MSIRFPLDWDAKIQLYEIDDAHPVWTSTANNIFGCIRNMSGCDNGSAFTGEICVAEKL